MKSLSKTLMILTISILIGRPYTLAQFHCELTHNPAEVKLIYDDIQNFMRAMKSIEKEGYSEVFFQKEYLDKASPGFKEYLRESGLKAKDYIEEIKKKPEQFFALKGLEKQLTSQEENIRGALSELKKLIPDVAFMPVYYFVGLSESGFNAQPSEYGLIIAISELAEKPEVVKLGIVHETIHLQQALAVGIEEYMQIFGSKMSLLALSIREGTAYYFTFLSTGEHTHKKAYDYLIKNEKVVWERFKEEMNNRLPGDWMFQKPKDPEQPIDLGYVVGARIVEAYYNRAEDKQKAIKEILSVKNFQEFLRISGYMENISVLKIN